MEEEKWGIERETLLIMHLSGNKVLHAEKDLHMVVMAA